MLPEIIGERIMYLHEIETPQLGSVERFKYMRVRVIVMNESLFSVSAT